MKLWLLIAGAGAAGTLVRFSVARYVQSRTGEGFPWGTATVNLVGCFLFGLVFVLASEKAVISDDMKQVILIGFMGALTTFSSFGFETSRLISDGSWGLACATIALNNLAGIALCFAGMYLGRWVA